MKETSVAIGIPNTGTIKTKTVASLVATIRSLHHPNVLLMQEGSVLHWNREELVKAAIKRNATHLLFVDDDMVFEKDAANRLMERNKDIVGVHYNCRKFPATTTVHMDAEKKKNIQWENPDGFMTCDAVGTGFLLINLDVFKKLKEPWFFWKTNEQGEVVEGEDYWFCRLAREAGFEVWIDLTVKVLHIGDHLF